MVVRHRLWALLCALVLASPTGAWAFGGGPGCANLPEYDRAVGALEGMTGACDMTVEQAQRIVAQHDGTAIATPPRAEGQASGARSSHHARHRRSHHGRRSGLDGR